MAEIASIIYTVLAIILVLFQLALAAGAPWGKITMGGFHPGVLPTKLRVAAVAQAILVAGTALIVLVEAGRLLPDLQSVSSIGIWFVVILYTISSILNLITSSVWERRTGGPVSICMLICSLIIALT